MPVDSCDVLINWKLFFKQKNENRFYLKEVNVSMYLANGSGKQSIDLGEKSVGDTEGIETIIVLLPNSALFNGTEDSMGRLYLDHNLKISNLEP